MRQVLLSLTFLAATLSVTFANADQSAPASTLTADHQAVKAARQALRAAKAQAFADRQTSPVYRYVGPLGYHLFALVSDGTGIPPEFTLEGKIFNVYASPYAKTTPLYRCNTSGHEMLSVDGTCEGQTMRAIIGYVSTVQVHDLQPLYRMSLNGDYLEDTATDEGIAAGYNVEGILGYVP